jgi:pilus assembly protein FimV
LLHASLRCLGHEGSRARVKVDLFRVFLALLSPLIFAFFPTFCMRFSSLVLCFGAALLAAPQDAQALSFGRVRSAVTLGQPLNIAIPVSLDDSEQITAECIRADVLHGDSPLPANVVRARITQGTGDESRVVRVSTTTVIQEPVVIVTVHAGCPSRVSRSYTLLADPPVALPETSNKAEGDGAGNTPRMVGANTANGASNIPSGGATRGRAAAPAAGVTPKPVAPRSVTRSTAAARNAPAVAAAPSDGGAVPQSAASAPRADRPRLQLDGGAVAMARSASDQSATEDAASARANLSRAEAAASAAEGRLRLLESEILRLRADSKAQLDVIAKMQAQMVQADNASRWLPWALAVALASMLAALWMAMRLRQLQQAKARRGWWANSRDFEPKGAGAETAVPSQLPDSRLHDTGLPEPKLPKLNVPGAAALGETTSARPRAVMPLASGVATQINSDFSDAHRAVTVDEQIDLEQEADFFIALGHDDAAIDLLLAHLRSTGGSAPMPYLKLLDMYRRRGDRDDYELMRRRFNQRFNSVAPEWEHDPLAGRVLEDYPLLVQKLQALWPKPIDAMAELEAMAFGRSGDDRELIDLPAYQDVLFLYQMARGLHDASRNAAGQPEDDVDVLLPLGGDAPSEPIMATLSPAGAGASGFAPLGAGLVMPASVRALDLDISTGHVPLAPAPQVPYRPDPIGALPMIDLDLPLNAPPSAPKK